VPSHRADTPTSRRRPDAPAAVQTTTVHATAVQATAGRITTSVSAAPASRAALRAAQGPLTSRAARRSAERASVRPSLSVPQVGIASALGLATIAAPLTGALAAPAAKAAAEPVAAVVAAAPPAAAFPRVSVRAANAVENATLVPGENETSVVPRMLVAPRSIIVTKASRGTRERSVLPGCDGVVPKDASWSNGQIPENELCTLWESDHMLRADAAVAVAKLNIAYTKRFGEGICLTDSYRTLSEQRRLKAIKPGLAAQPGTSRHGWGLALDLCGGVDSGGVRYQWLRENGPAYGWDNPDWALPGGSGPTELWHWEYQPGELVGPGSD
jgi:hypothetical protein